MNKDLIESSEHAPIASTPKYVASSIDGDCIVVADKTALPLRCVKTNEKLSEREYGIHTLGWASPWAGVASLASFFLAFLAFFATKRECRVKFGMSRSVRSRYLRRKALGWLGLFSGCYLILIFSFSAENIAVAVCSGFVVVVISLTLLTMGTSPLRIVKYQDGLFWVRGCGSEFLANLES